MTLQANFGHDVANKRGAFVFSGFLIYHGVEKRLSWTFMSGCQAVQRSPPLLFIHWCACKVLRESGGIFLGFNRGHGGMLPPPLPVSMTVSSIIENVVEIFWHRRCVECRLQQGIWRLLPPPLLPLAWLLVLWCCKMAVSEYGSYGKPLKQNNGIAVERKEKGARSFLTGQSVPPHVGFDPLQSSFEFETRSAAAKPILWVLDETLQRRQRGHVRETA